MKLTFLFFFSLFSWTLISQEHKVINGKIVSRSKDLEGIYIANVNSGQNTLSSLGGYFNLSASLGDTLMFSNSSFLAYQHVLSKKDFERDIILFPLEPNEFYTKLDEIVIVKITPESLGLIPEGTKRLTPAERSLYTATSGGGLIAVDALVNWASGRTKMLKQAVAYEKQELKKEKILNLFDAQRLFKDFGIPLDYAQGFGYYAASDAQMSVLLSGGTIEKEKIHSRLGELSLDFIELIQTKNNSSVKVGP
ncbi:hypothetical protein ACYSNM_02995 [Myroides sp. LJL116]